MATPAQSDYIADLSVLKTKEFKEVKELIVANAIVGDKAELVKNAESIAQITHALTDLQASKLIDALIATKEPSRGRVYSKRRIDGASGAIENIKRTIDGWSFG